MSSSPGMARPSGCERSGADPNGAVPRVSQVNGPTFSTSSPPREAATASSVLPSLASATSSSAALRASGRASTIRQARNTSSRAD